MATTTASARRSVSRYQPRKRSPSSRNNPREALERFRSADSQERALLVSELGKDVGSLASSALEHVFRDIFESKNLFDYLDGTTAQKRDALAFVRDDLAIGSDHLVDDEIDNLATRIIQRNLVQASDDTVFVAAMDALVALSRGKRGIRSGVLEGIDRFVSALGTDRNSSKPEIVRILLQELNEQATASAEDQIVRILIMLGRNAVGADRIIQQIEARFHERIDQISKPELSLRLHEAMGAWK